MLEGFGSLLVLLAAVAAAAVTVHWQRSKHEADLLRDNFKTVVGAGAEFFASVSDAQRFLLTELRQGGHLCGIFNASHSRPPFVASAQHVSGWAAQ